MASPTSIKNLLFLICIYRYIECCCDHNRWAVQHQSQTYSSYYVSTDIPNVVVIITDGQSNVNHELTLPIMYLQIYRMLFKIIIEGESNVNHKLTLPIMYLQIYQMLL